MAKVDIWKSDNACEIEKAVADFLSKNEVEQIAEGVTHHDHSDFEWELLSEASKLRGLISDIKNG